MSMAARSSGPPRCRPMWRLPDMWVKAKNGNVVKVDSSLAARAKRQGHEVLDSDPRQKKAAPAAAKK